MKRTAKRTSERRLETKLGNLLDRVLSRNGGGWTDTFEGQGILTNNRGLVVFLGNGQEFQLTIVESTRR